MVMPWIVRGMDSNVQEAVSRSPGAMKKVQSKDGI